MTKTTKKKKLGQFFTKNDFWLKDHIKEFITNSKTKIAFDPFAGNGDLLQSAKNLGYKEVHGLDIDDSLGWKINDSLKSMPKIRTH